MPISAPIDAIYRFPGGNGIDENRWLQLHQHLDGR